MIENELALYVYGKSSDSFTYLQETPSQKLPIITQGDAVRGYITRYFVRPVNDKLFIVEVDETQYQQFKINPRFITTSFKWRITGKKENYTINGHVVPGVEEYNRIQVQQVDLTFGGLVSYITNYLQFWVADGV